MAVAALLLMASCRSKPCSNAGALGLSVTSASGSFIADSTLKVVRYDKITGAALDSFFRPKSDYPSNYFSVLFDTVSGPDYPFTLRATLYPSGKTYNITNIHHADDRARPGFSCVNAIIYSVDGQEQRIPGYLGMQGYIIDVAY